MQPITVSLQDLQQGRVSGAELDEAFGADSLGIIIVKNLDPEFVSLREKVLKSASRLAALPHESLNKLEFPQAHWLVGWSRGRENLNGVPDTFKGSFYINCSDKLPENGSAAYTTPNVWPEELPELENDCEKLIGLIVGVAQSLSAACDTYFVETFPDYPKGYLQKVVRDSTTSKARLLHYFPSTSNEQWCAEHVDHSCLTGLTSAMFIDENSHTEVGCPDGDAGLYIKSRNESVVKVAIPKDCLAFQTGSALQEVSRGSFRAVPHYVRGADSAKVARNTLAVFCQPSLDDMVNDSETFADYAERILKDNH